ncbi:hypothetical protein [Bacillus thuringiensis]|uniref:Uncharacterized protein n=1 Tax=Bacillus thuringiensis Bt18247 TaxID=1423143 RepID=A0A9W3SYV8_BACTU|nr:hypothetical protein [Bacillus thuringiensis]AOM14275.1 hypothetical protein BTI247_59440 [Bacillus thuringiensis Bt18247]MBG9523700.1 hypothetical protein [Bacillus thuringiensis]
MVKAHKLLARIYSTKRPLPGQEHRSSDNFRLIVPKGTRELLFHVIPTVDTEDECTKQLIYFDIMQDSYEKKGKIIYKNIQDSFTIKLLQSGRNFYISNPSGATANFYIVIYAVQ